MSAVLFDNHQYKAHQYKSEKGYIFLENAIWPYGVTPSMVKMEKQKTVDCNWLYAIDTMWHEIIYPFSNFNCATVDVLGMDKYFHPTLYWACH